MGIEKIGTYEVPKIPLALGQEKYLDETSGGGKAREVDTWRSDRERLLSFWRLYQHQVVLGRTRVARRPKRTVELPRVGQGSVAWKSTRVGLVGLVVVKRRGVELS